MDNCKRMFKVAPLPCQEICHSKHVELCETQWSYCYLLPKVVAAGELVPTLSLTHAGASKNSTGYNIRKGILYLEWFVLIYSWLGSCAVCSYLVKKINLQVGREKALCFNLWSSELVHPSLLLRPFGPWTPSIHTLITAVWAGTHLRHFPVLAFAERHHGLETTVSNLTTIPSGYFTLQSKPLFGVTSVGWSL